MCVQENIHPVTRENMNARKPSGAHWKVTISDNYGFNPPLIIYSVSMFPQKRIRSAACHYATIINAMPREVSAHAEFIKGNAA